MLPQMYLQVRISPGDTAVTSMAQEFVNAKIQPGKVVVFIKPSCPYCRKTQEILSQLPFKQGLLEFVDITATSHTSEIQDYLKQLTGARTVPRVFIGKDCIGGCTDLEVMQQNGELLVRLKQIGALQ
jgi:glutaredoxin 3|uniref:Glutaredoxin-1 n=1 Tax=Castor canadensis TaxID=51338 RepID=A0A8C0ZUE5_CASCN|nr:glutaredoxin-1 isoform X2 [Castor canadensis]